MLEVYYRYLDFIIHSDHNRLNKLQSYSTPSNSYVDLGVGAYGSKYTAPADGYFVFHLHAGSVNSANNASLALYNNNLVSTTISVSPLEALGTFIPAKKNDVIVIHYINCTNTGNELGLRFIYSKGAASQT